MQKRKSSPRNWVRILLVAVCLVAAPNLSAVHAGDRVTEGQGGYNNEYIFAATRGLADSSCHPGWKVMATPVTLVADVVFLPFALVMGFF